VKEEWIVLGALSLLTLMWWEYIHHKPTLSIDPKRVNDEDRRAHRTSLYEDVEYRNRVKQRMTEGKACQLKPLYDRPVLLAKAAAEKAGAEAEKSVLKKRQRRRGKNGVTVLAMPMRKEG